MKTLSGKYLLFLAGILGATAFGVTLNLAIPSLPVPVVILSTATAADFALFLIARPSHRASRIKTQRTRNDLHFKDVIYSFVVESEKTNNREDLYNLILQKAVEAIPNAKMATLLKLTDGGKMRFEASYGFDMSILKTVVLNLNETFCHVLTNGRYDRTVIVNDYHAFNQGILDPARYETLTSATEKVVSIMSAPINIDGELWGMLNIDSDAEKSFGPEHIDRLGIFVNETVKIIKLFKQQELSIWLARHDNLTRLFTRHWFTEKLQADLKLAAEGKLFGTLVSMDLDCIKSINDNFGHIQGDAALAYFASGFQTNLTESDYVSRYGGDEFVAVFIGKGIRETGDILSRIQCHFMENPLVLNGHGEIIRFSYGMVSINRRFHDHTRIMHLSDERMYRNKQIHRRIAAQSGRIPSEP